MSPFYKYMDVDSSHIYIINTIIFAKIIDVHHFNMYMTHIH